MKTRSVVLTPRDLATFIESDWQGFDTKDYEFIAALVLARFHMKQVGGKQRMAFPIKPGKERTGIEEAVEIEDIIRILRESTNQDTPLDFSIISEENISKGIHKGVAYQVKRVRPISGREYHDVLAERLNSLKNEYAPVQATFLMLLGSNEDGDASLDLGKIKELFNADGFPFQQVMFMAMKKDAFVMGEIWPNFGRNQYSIEEWFQGDEEFSS